MVFAIFGSLIGSGSSLPEQMAEEDKFLPMQDSLAHGSASVRANSKNQTSKDFGFREAILASDTGSIFTLRRAFEPRYLAADGIG